MKERITNLQVLRKQNQSIGPAIDRVICLSEEPGDKFWPERLHLEGTSGEIFLERAITRGGIIKSLREKTLPKLRDQEEQTRNFCNQLFMKGYTKEKVIQIVCDYFHVAIPEKSKE